MAVLGALLMACSGGDSDDVAAPGGDPVAASASAVTQTNMCSATLEAGPIWSNSHAGQVCPTVCGGRSGQWTGDWTTTVSGQMSVCTCSLPCGGPGGTIAAEFEVTAQGAATYTIPLDVPPGTEGVAPSLSLSYSSGGSNGALGMGFKLSGVSTIARCNRTQAQDGRRAGVKLTNEDAFCLDGQRLVRVGGAPDGSDGALYRTEVETFSRVMAVGNCGGGPCSFRMTTKNGQTVEYGTTDDSRILAPGRNVARAWAERRVISLNGNYLTMAYLLDQGQFYPQTIEYTRNDAIPGLLLRRVRFDYEDRPDVESACLAGSCVRTGKRLKSVRSTVTRKPGVGAIEELYKEYRLAYTSSTATRRSLLSSVTECGITECLPATTIQWQQAAVNGFEIVTPPGSEYQDALRADPGANIIPGDYNGDGKTDFIRQEHGDWDNDTIASFQVYLSRGDGNFDIVTPPDAYYQDALRADPGANIIPGDYNGDGKTDFIRQEHGEWGNDNIGTFQVYLSRGDGNFDRFEPQGDAYQFNLRADPGASIYPGDYDGDGKTDFIRQEHGGWDDDTNITFQVYFSRGGGSFDIVTPEGDAYQGKLQFDPGAYIIPGDYNGDGKTDFIRQEHGGWDDDTSSSFRVYLSRGDGYFDIVEPPGPEYQDALRADGGANIIPADYNGDGLTDFIRQEHGEWGNDLLGAAFQVYLSRGDGTFEIVTPPGAEYQDQLRADQGANIIPVDLNGDGKADFLRQEHGGWASDDIGTFQLYLSRGDGTFDRIEPAGSQYQSALRPDPGVNILPADYDGDGLTDFIRQEKNQLDDDVIASFQLYFARQARAADRLAAVTNGLGGRVDVEYAPLTDATVYGAGGENVAGAIAATPPMYVVKSYTQTNGRQGQAASTTSYDYRYEGGRVALDGRGWLGFAAMQVTERATGQVTRTTFRQAFPLTGTVRTIDVSDDDRHIKTSYEYDDVVQLQGVHQVLRKSERIERTEGSAVVRTLVQLDYDAYGSVRLVRENGVEGSSDDDHMTCTTYQNDPNGALGLPLETRSGSSCTVQGDFCTCTGNGEVTRRGYSTDGRLNLVLLAVAGDLSFQNTFFLYDAAGNVIQETRPTGAVVQRTLDPDYATFPIEVVVKGAGGQVITNAHAAFDPGSGLERESVGANGERTVQAIDGLGRVVGISRTSPTGSLVLMTTFTWASGWVDRRDRVDWTSDEWSLQETIADGLGQPLTEAMIARPGGHGFLTTTELDGAGRVARQSQPFRLFVDTPRYTTFTYDQGGHLTSATSPLGVRTEYQSALGGCPNCVETVTTTEAAGTAQARVSTRYEDAHGRVLKRVDAQQRVSTFVYDDQGRLLEAHDPQGETTFTVDRLGRVVTSTSTDSGTTTNVYDVRGLLVSSTDGAGKRTEYTYDALGRVLTEASAGRRVEYTYDTAGTNAIGRLGSVRTFRIAPGTTTQTLVAQHVYAYTPEGQVVSDTLTLADRTYTTSFRRDPSGEILQLTYPDGSVLDREHDTDGFLSALKLGGTTYASFSDYNASAQPSTMAYGNGTRTTYSYDDALRLLTAKTLASDGTPLLDYGYDWYPTNDIQAIRDGRDPSRTQTFGYSQAGDLVSASGIYGARTYAYDGAGNLTSKDGVVYTYQGHRVKSGSDGFSATYDDAGNRKHQERGGHVWDFSFDDQNRLSQVVVDGNKQARYSYDFDGARVEKIDSDGVRTLYVGPHYEVELRPGGGERRTRYIDGPSGRVASVTVDAAAGSALFPVVPEGGPPPGEVLPRALTRDVALALAALLALLATLLTGKVAHARWTGRAAGAGLGFRRPGLAWVVPLLLLTYGTAATGCASSPGGGLASIEAATSTPGAGRPLPGTVFFHQNHIGSTTMVTDATGQVVSRTEYLPYGGIYAPGTSGSDVARAKFTGKELDQDAELYYFDARYYDPVTGRFLTPDSLVQGGPEDRIASLNPYAYAVNNPITFVDPSGHWAFLVAMLIGAVVGAFMGGATVNGSMNPASWNWRSWKTYVGMWVGSVVGGWAGAAGVWAAGAVGGGLAGAVAGGMVSGLIDGVAIEGLRFMSPEGSNAETFFEGVSTSGVLGGASGGVMHGAGSALGRAGRGMARALQKFRTPPVRRTPSDIPCVMSCFVAGTEVATEDGERAIEDIREGDWVYAYNEENDALELRRVISLFHREATAIVTIDVGDDVIEVTPEHPFWVDGVGWRPAGELQEGDTLVSLDGRVVTVKDTHAESRATTVYNFEVEEAHTYFVSGEETLVHNCRAGRSLLTRNADRSHDSPGGLHLRPGRATHVFEHARNNNSKEFHGVFEDATDSNRTVVELLDEAMWTQPSASYRQANGNLVTVHPMGRSVGWEGGYRGSRNWVSNIVMVWNRRGSSLVTAFPAN